MHHLITYCGVRQTENKSAVGKQLCIRDKIIPIFHTLQKTSPTTTLYIKKKNQKNKTRKFLQNYSHQKLWIITRKWQFVLFTDSYPFLALLKPLTVTVHIAILMIIKACTLCITHYKGKPIRLAVSNDQLRMSPDISQYITFNRC